MAMGAPIFVMLLIAAVIVLVGLVGLALLIVGIWRAWPCYLACR